MTPLFLYLIKVNIALVFFYTAYRYGLRRLTFYTLNRFFLLLAIGFSSVYPLIDVNALLPGSKEPGGQIIQYLPNLGSLARENPLEIWNLLTLVFWSGVVVMAIRFLLQCVSLARIHFTSVKQDANQQDLRIIKDKINPFSFFRNIYINPMLHSAEEQRAIIAHEKVHAKEWHTADILAGELNRIFYWFNPGAWLMITAIRENLEFITDRRVLRDGTDAKTYQYSLVKASGIPYASALANNFNFSHLKIRITMMDKKPSSELHLVKYLLLIPFVAALTLAFNVTKADFTPPVIVKLPRPLIAPTDTLPEKAPDWATNKEIYKHGNFTGYAKTMSLISHIGNEDPVVLDGKLTNGKEALEIVRKNGVIYAARLKNELAQYYVPGKNLLYWLETKGKASNRPDLPPPPEVVPQKDEVKVKEVRFTPPKIVPKKEKEVDSIPPPRITEIRFNSKKSDLDKTQEGPIMLLDGVRIESIKGIHPDDIASISVLKGEQATSLFGKKAEGGAVLIVSKANKMPKGSKSITVDTISVDHSVKLRNNSLTLAPKNDVLYVVDDVQVSAEKIRVLSPNKIKSINILKDQSATDKYGAKGKEGVIEIVTKEKETSNQ